MISSESARAWLDRLAALNVSRSHTAGIAPHKPFLLLAILDMIEAGSLTTPTIDFCAELNFRFKSFWDVVAPRRTNAPDMRMPFHALGGARDRIWQRLTSTGAPSPGRDATTRVAMEPGLWALLHEPQFRRSLRETLVASYFEPSERAALYTRLDLPIPRDKVIAALRKRAEEWQTVRRRARDSRFRTMVVAGYRFTCALTGYRMHSSREPMIEAAHIHQHSKSGNDDPSNGLALTPDAHWAFDRGLWTAVPDGRHWVVRVASDVHEEPPGSPRSLLALQGRPLVFADGTRLRPDGQCFAWHREHCFVG